MHLLIIHNYRYINIKLSLSVYNTAITFYQTSKLEFFVQPSLICLFDKELYKKAEPFRISLIFIKREEMTRAETIKQNIKIEDIAERYNAGVTGKGNTRGTRHNPLRAEKTSSLKLYIDTNSWSDYGSGKGGSVIDFVMEAESCEYGDAIETIERLTGSYTPVAHYAPLIQKQEHMKPEAVKRLFKAVSSPLTIDNVSCMDNIMPRWLISQASSEDKQLITNIVRYDKQEDTAVVMPLDESGTTHTFKYRYKDLMGERKKWVSAFGTKSNYTYCRLLDNSTFTLVVEGTRDYLTAIACGYSVVALPSANYIPNLSLFVDRLCVFIDDDDNKNSMNALFEKVASEKILFNHSKFKELIKCDSKDLSDYVQNFDNLVDFKNTFERFIFENQEVVAKHWKDDLATDKLVTLESLSKISDADFLVDGFINRGTSTVIHSNPGAGKTILVLALAKQLLRENKIDEVIYFDADNPQSVLKDRLPKVLTDAKDNFTYWSSSTTPYSEMRAEMQRLTGYHNQGGRVLVVIDTFGRFVNGSVKTDSDVVPILQDINLLVNSFGATVIVIHHSNKAKDDDGKPIFQGSQRIIGDTDACWGLTRDKGIITAYQNKVRFGGMHDYIEFAMDADNVELLSTVGKNLSDANDKEDEEEDKSDKVAQEIHAFLTKIGEANIKSIHEKFKGIYSRRAIENVVKNNEYKKVLWYFFKGEKNEWLYKAIQQPQEIIYNPDELFDFPEGL